MKEKIIYRDFEIYPTDPVPPIPGWQAFAWTYCHKDYDGPEDNRYGHAPTPEECKSEIDDLHYEDEDEDAGEDADHVEAQERDRSHLVHTVGQYAHEASRRGW